MLKVCISHGSVCAHILRDWANSFDIIRLKHFCNTDIVTFIFEHLWYIMILMF